ncbi:MAG TPA: PQQ-dependent sugar dehydrogenase [Gemmatimonadales bacterium]|nr:PQQ-dependent sugar dehydrogenase [Gemmatimonadales bacterium]
MLRRLHCQFAIRNPQSAISYFALVFLLACSSSSSTGTPPPPPGSPALQLLSSSLSEPVYVTAPPGETARFFVIEKTGTIRIFRHDTLLGTPFLDISSQVSTGSEQGLLSMAFHPNYATNGCFYVSYTNTTGDTRIVRYTVSADPNVADATTGDTILTVAQPFENHNGGLVLFGPDGKLWIGLGDGGGSGDTAGNGQNRHVLLGKLLRVDVDAGSPYAIPAGNPFAGDTSARGEIWAYGLRNPWRFSFDRQTGDLYIGDVGQNLYEEIDVQAAGTLGGQNYGWHVMEGKHCYNPSSGCNMTGLTMPLVEYDHTQGCAITGGYVYRGSVAALAGQYLYSDYCSGFVKSFVLVLGRPSVITDWSADLPTGGNVSSFGEDAKGEVYITTLDGKLYRIVSR